MSLVRLENFVGNSRLVERLRASSLPQASLFTGPEGVGKQTLALSLAAGKNCKEKFENRPCGSCSSCVKIAGGNHPDIMLFYPEKRLIRIDEMRRMNKEVQFRPFEGRVRVFVVDQAETMTPEAANSILKTLEEPPESSRIILVSAFPHRLLPTVRSRCQQFSFLSLKREEIRSFLTEQALEGDTELRSALARGSIGTALELNLKEVLEDRDRVLDVLETWLGQESFSQLYAKCELPPLRGDLKKRERVRSYLDLLQQVCEDLYFIYVETPNRVVHRDRFPDLEKLSRKLSLSLLVDLLYDIDQSRWALDHYVSPLMCFETLWLMNRKGSKDAGNRNR